MAVSAERSEDHHKVTCGSAVKLTHKETGFRLHSHDIKYGSGSGQQSITGYPNADDPNSYFVVEAEHGKECDRGLPFECGSKVRLFHVSTGKYLHSHLHQSPLSRGQEVSAFEVGNTDDNWTVHCSTTVGSQKNKFWLRDQDVQLSHAATGKYLSASGKYAYGQPIYGQLEIAAVASTGSNTLWSARVYIATFFMETISGI